MVHLKLRKISFVITKKYECNFFFTLNDYKKNIDFNAEA